jgi:hypothetical protein
MTENVQIKRKISIKWLQQQILENESRILLGKRKDAKYQYKLKKKTDSLKHSNSNTMLVLISITMK